MTMKLTKMAGAFALTAALAMTAVPAFAVASAENVDNFQDVNAITSAATTKVYAQTVNAALNATIPTKVAIVVPSSGAGEVTAPSSAVYKIVNKGTTPVFLKGISSQAGIFKLSATDVTSGNDATLTMTVNSNALDGTSKTLSGANATEIAGNNGELALILAGKSFVPPSSPLNSAQLESAAMQITYTIGTTA